MKVKIGYNEDAPKPEGKCRELDNVWKIIETETDYQFWDNPEHYLNVPKRYVTKIELVQGKEEES